MREKIQTRDKSHLCLCTLQICTSGYSTSLTGRKTVSAIIRQMIGSPIHQPVLYKWSKHSCRTANIVANDKGKIWELHAVKCRRETTCPYYPVQASMMASDLVVWKAYRFFQSFWNQRLDISIITPYHLIILMRYWEDGFWFLLRVTEDRRAELPQSRSFSLTEPFLDGGCQLIIKYFCCNMPIFQSV